MDDQFDAFGNNRSAVRIPHPASTVQFDQTDLRNVKSAINELGGFDGAALTGFMSIIGTSREDLLEFSERLEQAGQLALLPARDLCTLMSLCNAVCAALGDEELAPITGSGRDEYFLTIRRLYYSFKRQSGKLRG